MRATSEALALRQCESLAVLSQELFCSPDIIRQGSMDLWNPRTSSWGCCHFVLTRAGFLHWFKDINCTTPLEPPLNLSKYAGRGATAAGPQKARIYCRHD